MNENNEYIIETNEDKTATAKLNRFPVIWQLLIIFILMGGLFAGLIIPTVTEITKSEELQPIKNAAALTEPSENNITLQKIESIPIKAKSAYVWDVKEQRVLYKKNDDEKLPLASITKLMTALLAYELVGETKKVTINETAQNQESGGNLMAGEVFPIRDLADFALVSSYNSASYAIANSVGEELDGDNPVSNFVTAMNIRSEDLELNNLRFLNPTGLDVSAEEAGAYGTAKDVTFLMEYILARYPEILRPTIFDSIDVYNQAGERHSAKNTNLIVNEIPNLIGSKTGYTDLAGGNLTVALDIGFNHPVIITVLGSTISERFSDVEKIIEAVQVNVVNN